MKKQTYFKKQREAILNNSHRQKLLKQLFDLYNKSLPMILKKENGDIICCYSDEVEESATKIKEQINAIENEVFNSIK